MAEIQSLMPTASGQLASLTSTSTTSRQSYAWPRGIMASGLHQRRNEGGTVPRFRDRETRRDAPAACPALIFAMSTVVPRQEAQRRNVAEQNECPCIADWSRQSLAWHI